MALLAWYGYGLAWRACYGIWYGLAGIAWWSKAWLAKRLELNKRLANTLGLGFTQDAFEPGKPTVQWKQTVWLSIESYVCTFLKLALQIRLHNGRPSTLLRSIPVENEKCYGGRTQTFTIQHYKRLASSVIPQLSLSILDVSGERVHFT